MKKEFQTEEEFNCFTRDKYQFGKCNKCGNYVELSIEKVQIIVKSKTMDFDELPLLRCTSCDAFYLTKYSKCILEGCYNELKERKDNGVRCLPKNKIRFNYCYDVEFDYDYRDYENIPGLLFDEEHSEPGYLQPVYFSKEALIAFVGNPEYEVNLFSESYGEISKKDSMSSFFYEWSIPFGFNSKGKLVMWLGDIDALDKTSKMLLKAYNVPSDHLIVQSEYYQAQIEGIFSEPSIEKQIILRKNIFIKNVFSKYQINLEHLREQNEELEVLLQRPIAYTNQALYQVINAFRRHLIEGIDVNGLRKLYEYLWIESERDINYLEYKAIKLMDKILLKLLPKNYTEEYEKALIAPLYLLNDYRNILDHSIGSDEEKLKNNILRNLGVDNFDEQEKIYYAEINRLNRLYLMLDLLTQ